MLDILLTYIVSTSIFNKHQTQEMPFKKNYIEHFINI